MANQQNGNNLLPAIRAQAALQRHGNDEQVIETIRLAAQQAAAIEMQSLLTQQTLTREAELTGQASQQTNALLNDMADDVARYPSALQPTMSSHNADIYQGHRARQEQILNVGVSAMMVEVARSVTPAEPPKKRGGLLGWLFG